MPLLCVNTCTPLCGAVHTLVVWAEVFSTTCSGATTGNQQEKNYRTYRGRYANPGKPKRAGPSKRFCLLYPGAFMRESGSVYA